jgi:hypothetical protein
MAKVCFLFTNVGEGVFSEVRVAPVRCRTLSGARSLPLVAQAVLAELAGNELERASIAEGGRTCPGSCKRTRSGVVQAGARSDPPDKWEPAKDEVDPNYFAITDEG